jgi:hypothetical protein
MLFCIILKKELRGVWLIIGLQMNALKNLGLNVVKANVYLDSSGKHNKFSITKA